MLSCECLNCGEARERIVSYDEFGWHSYCEPCGSSFDVNVDGDYLVTLWTHESDRAIDDFTETEKADRIVDQFTFRRKKKMDECKDLLQKLDTFEGMVYELHEVSSGQSIALGVFGRESLYDDIWYADEHITEMREEQTPGLEMQ